MNAYEMMNGIHQFNELFQGGGKGVEFRQGGVHGCKAQGRVGAAKTTHPGKRGGRRVHGQELYVPAPQLVDDVVQFSQKIAKRPRRRDHGIALCSESSPANGMVSATRNTSSGGSRRQIRLTRSTMKLKGSHAA